MCFCFPLIRPWGSQFHSSHTPQSFPASCCAPLSYSCVKNVQHNYNYNSSSVCPQSAVKVILIILNHVWHWQDIQDSTSFVISELRNYTTLSKPPCDSWNWPRRVKGNTPSRYSCREKKQCKVLDIQIYLISLFALVCLSFVFNYRFGRNTDPVAGWLVVTTKIHTHTHTHPPTHTHIRLCSYPN